MRGLNIGSGSKKQRISAYEKNPEIWITWLQIATYIALR